MRGGRYLIGVLGAELHSNEQRQILCGIIEAAQAARADTAVLSNIFNPLEPEQADCCENQIYDLVLSPDLDAVIMLVESVVSEGLRARIRRLLTARADIPVILVGAAPEGFDFPSISTSDANDIAEITEHLITGHGFRDIALLTGPLTMEVSHIRIAGYRCALERNGIPFDEARVYEGNFWYDSGEALARQFLSGALPMPQALVCANDYMAFGVLDAFEYADVNLLDRMAVIGYEFVTERNLHTPLLTTYQRNRHALGRSAVEILLRRLRGEPEQPFSPPRGRLIHGVTCACNVSRIRQHEELIAARLNKQYADWNLKSELERLLTECTDMDAFAEAMGRFLFMVRNVTDIILCLFEDWHRAERSSDILLCRSVNLWADHTVFRIKQTDLAGITAREKEPRAYYILPLCFRDRLFGYCVLRYDQPDSYDDVCRSWMKSVANGLEFLRLKADVRYLLQCRALSGSYDSMTGMFSADGLNSAYQLMQRSAGTKTVTAFLLRCCTEDNPLYSAEDAGEVIGELLAAAKALQQFQGGICGRTAEYEFLLLLPTDPAVSAHAVRAVTAELLEVLEADTFLCTAAQFSCETPLDALRTEIAARAEQEAAKDAGRRLLPLYPSLHMLRSGIYREPAAAHSIEDSAAALGFHIDYLNRRYKACFGLSFHQDCIRARVMHAVSLLLHTDMTVAKTAECCGYTESKYFIRQFAAVTGCPPREFRSRMRSILAMNADT